MIRDTHRRTEVLLEVNHDERWFEGWCHDPRVTILSRWRIYSGECMQSFRSMMSDETEDGKISTRR